MSKTIDQGKEEVANLCRYFATNHQAFLAPGVKEDHVRQSLIDPFFEALGWDVHNKARTAPQYQEVIPEDSLDVEGQQKAPDYTFRVGLLPKFYAEAKRCGVNIGADPAPAFQLRRYGYSRKLALSILTDFEELGVYDCTMRPHPSDKASHARIQYFRFDEYPDRWRELWDVFSREAVWSGAFDQYAASKRKRGTSEVDVEFLKDMEGWRLALAGNIALRNKGLSLDDLNAAVQLTIDRVVFLRMAEDRGLEPYEQLLKLCERPDIYPRFMHDLCRQADQKYNSGLFHFLKESGVSEDPDRITPKLTVDDKVFKPILESLYFAHGSPYHFGVLPVEILGTVYERFLGKVIRLTAGHQAKIEEKPEVRKAGGVYYTPAYIVEYIVKHTVGQQIEGRSPAQLARGTGILPVANHGQDGRATFPAGASGRQDGGATFRVLDMACGSGSFLLGAYQRLLHHCFDWYVEHDPKKHKKAVYKDPRNGQWRLTIEERKRILTTHIFGVDIDLQAVEVTKLSLLLKVLEGETDQSLSLSQLAFGDRALPNLADNIKCGNSLIGPDYFAGKLIVDPEEMKRVNPFDWKQGFPDAMKAGGFDCIIGNPPYLRIQGLQEYYGDQIEYFAKYYQSAVKRFDLYLLFLEQGFRLLSPGGCLGIICPHKFVNSDFGSGLRQFLVTNNAVKSFVSFGNNLVFRQASTYTGIVLLEKGGNSCFAYAELPDLPPSDLPRRLSALTEAHFASYDLKAFSGAPWVLTPNAIRRVLDHLSRQPLRLAAVCQEILVGVQSGIDSIHVLREVACRSHGIVRCFSERANSEVDLEHGLVKPFLQGDDVHRYEEPRHSYYCIYPYQLDGGKTRILEESELRERYPLGYTYLREYRTELREKRIHQKTNPTYWYSCHRSRDMAVFERMRIVTPYVAVRCNMSLVLGGVYHNTKAYSIVPSVSRPEQILYWLGILNSHLLWWFISNTGYVLRGGYYAFTTDYLSPFPVPALDYGNPADVSRHNRMVALVDSMLGLHKQLAAANSEAQKGILHRQIDATDAEIDNLVYELYGITNEERKIIEGNL